MAHGSRYDGPIPLSRQVQRLVLTSTWLLGWRGDHFQRECRSRVHLRHAAQPIANWMRDPELK